MEEQTAVRRGRVVMLVDNAVDGDSRVQKAAQSAAEAGWEVFLVGIMGPVGPETWHIGDAEVRLFKVPRRLGHASRLRRGLLRRPLAYPPGPHASLRVAKINAWKTDIRTRQALTGVARREGRPVSIATRARNKGAWFVARVVGRWAKFRSDELDRLQASRGRGDSPLVSVPMRFWQWRLKERSWRKLDPSLWDYELPLGRRIDALRPDLIHANDFRMVGVGARAAIRARSQGRQVKLVYDAHEYVPGIAGRPADARWLPAQIAYEKEFVAYADAVMTVSPTLAELLQEGHNLSERPAVVLNAPPRERPAGAADTPVPDLREMCGISSDTPLLTYCGGVNPTRGLDIMIEALTRLTDVHVALVVVHPAAKNPLDSLRQLAEERGVADRVHFLPYVPHWQVPRYLAPADVGVIPIHHRPNHEIALITKFFEYSHARLPLVVSDVRTMADTVRETGQGEVFRAEDLDDFVRAVQAVLAEPKRYRDAYDTPGLLDGWTWEAQADIQDKIYRRVLGFGPSRA
ncbi:MAG: glycosyltransferase [Micromonosporaceae bacterium]